MGYFPFFMDLNDKNGLIVGGGTVALRKIEKLLPYGPRLTAVAPEILPEIRQIRGLSCLERLFCPEDINGMFFVIAASDDRALNHHIAALCRTRNIPVNVVDDRDACTFLFPALIQKGDLSIGISTGGNSPLAAVYLKEQIRTLLPEDFDGLLTYLGALRPAVKHALPEGGARAACFSRIFSACLEVGWPLPHEHLQQLLRHDTAKDAESAASGFVSLVGAGCGSADLITLRGLRRLQACDTVIYDDLIDPELLRYAPAHAQRIYMGKRSGRHSASQEEICMALIEHAKNGEYVVRLKGGDPFVFGRGGEELLALQAAGVPFEEIPGISSAIAIPAEAGIPVTHRGLAQSVHIITAHTADTTDGLPDCLDTLAALPGTLIFLMGLSALPRICERLLTAGMAPETPAAVLSGGNSPHAVTVRATLETISDHTARAGVQPPAVIVIGEVAALTLLSQNDTLSDKQ